MKNNWVYILVLLSLATCVTHAQTLFGMTGVNGTASSLYTVNTTTGAATLVGASGVSGISSLAVGPDGSTLFAVVNSTHVLVKINTSTGAATTVGATGLSANIPDIAVRSDGVIFGADGNGVMHTFNSTTGTASTLGSLGIGFIGGGAIAFDSSGTLYLAAAVAGNSAQLYTVNQSTGAATLVGAFDFSALPMGTDRLAGMKFHPITGVLYATAFVNIDPADTTRIVSATSKSGSIALTSIGDPGVVLESVAFATPGAPSSVPAPPTFVLLGVGFLALMGWTLYRRTPRSAV